MMNGQTYLMNADELQIVAAASGMSTVMIFQPRVSFDRTRQIMAILRLIRDGFFIQDDSSIKISPKLAPLTKVLSESAYVNVIRTFDASTPPCCVYYNSRTDRFVLITTHHGKEDLYRLCIADPDDLADKLEELKMIPTLYDDQFAVGTMDPRELADIMESLDMKEGEPCLGISEDHITSTFERSATREYEFTAQLVVCSASPTWVTVSKKNQEYAVSYYCRDNVLKWLKGEEP